MIPPLFTPNPHGKRTHLCLALMLASLLTGCQSMGTPKPQSTTTSPDQSTANVSAPAARSGETAESSDNDTMAESEEALRDHASDNVLVPPTAPLDMPKILPASHIHDPWFDLFQNNRAIQAAANEWLTWKRPQLLQTWRHYLMLKNQIKPAFTRASIEEPLFVAIMAQESGGRVHSSSRAGAAGLFQLMPATARRLGLRGTQGDYDLRYSPAHAAAAAARFLREQMRLYDNDLAKVLAAYNSGENRFRRLNRQHKNQDFWDPSFYYDLPAETRGYVPAVLAAMLLYKYPQAFNLSLPALPPGHATTAMQVTLTQPASLSQLAVCLGQENNPMGWYRDLRNLNHGIRANRDLPAGTRLWIPAAAHNAWLQQCQNSDLMALAHQLHQADFPEKPPMVTYVVRSGDALSTIARRFSCTSRREVARLNNLKGPRYLIRVGQKLKIPQC